MRRTSSNAASTSSSVRRRGSYAVIDIEGLAGTTVTSRLDALGTGCYQWLVLLSVGLACMPEAMETGSVAAVSTALSHKYGFDTEVRSELPLMVNLGSAFGFACAGFFCDSIGRKRALMSSLVVSAACMLATAMLSAHASTEYILALRFLTGAAGAMQLPAGIALAVESCPLADRAQLVFGLAFMSQLGFFVEAFGQGHFMPHFGEAGTDRWRAYCMFTAACSLVPLPLVCCLHESPCFHGVRGDNEKCVEALNAIAWWNGKPTMRKVESQFPEPLRPEQRAERTVSDWLQSLGTTLDKSASLIMLLCIIDGCRGFLLTGFSYLCKDLYILAGGQSAEMNIIATSAPLIGLVFGSRFTHYGVRAVTCCASVVAAVSLALMEIVPLRTSPWDLLVLSMTTKVTFGVLNSCVSLMKIEAFPTEIRVTAYSFICIFAKILGSTAPTLVENLKGSEAAASWSTSRLSFFIFLLLAAATISGALAPLVPGRAGDGVPLEDFVERQDGMGKFKTHLDYGATRSTSQTFNDAEVWDPLDGTQSSISSGVLDQSRRSLDNNLDFSVRSVGSA